MSIICNNCGHEIAEGSTFCSECGTRVNESTVKPLDQSNNQEVSATQQPVMQQKAPMPQQPVIQQTAPVPQQSVMQQTAPMPQQPVMQQTASIPQARPIQPANPIPVAPVVPQRPPVNQSVPMKPVQPAPPFTGTDEVKPKGGKYGVAGTGAFFGLMFLYAIPVIGWIVCIIMCFAPKNQNIKHYSRANLIWLLIGITIAVILYFLLREWVITIFRLFDQFFERFTDTFKMLDVFKDFNMNNFF